MKTSGEKSGFSDREWEELAAALSDERNGNDILLSQFSEDDGAETVSYWKKIGTQPDREDKPDVDRAWNKLSSRLKSDGLIPSPAEPATRTLWPALLRIASVVLVIVTLGISAGLIYKSGTFARKTTIATTADEKNKLITLPDGSSIWLNRNSELSYRESFGKKKRNVTLRGEAFFEIAHNADLPFTVDAGKARVRVVGTSFNVITENGNNEVEVFVKTGRVMLSGNSGENAVMLDPGFVGITGGSKPVKILNDNINYMSWKEERLEYTGQTLDVVFRDLKRVYNIDIIAGDSTITENTWTSPIDSQSPETIVRIICASFNLNYSKEGNVYHLSEK